jgi:hypothetical protein
MRVKLKSDVSGTRDGQPWPARGEEVDLPDDEGAALCAAGMAEPVAVKASGQAEKAVAPKAETRRGAGRE